MNCSDPLILPKAILFDMDGTLTEDRLDFDEIKGRLGLGEAPILESLARMPPEERTRAEGILHKWEAEGAADCRLNHGCLDLLDWLDAHGILSALITRNTRRSVETVLEKHGLSFEVRITREDGQFKPHPEPLWLACERLKVKPEEAWMVGDWKYDIEAGNAAGVRTVWLSYGRKRVFEAVPWRTVADLPALSRLLAGCATSAS